MMFWGQEETVEIPKFNFGEFMMDTSPLLGIQVYHWLIWLLIFVFCAYIYNKVFRARKPPLLQSIIVYTLLVLGGFLLLVFEVDSNLPIVYSLGIAMLLLLIVRVRYWVQERASNQSGKSSEEETKR